MKKEREIERESEERTEENRGRNEKDSRLANVHEQKHVSASARLRSVTGARCSFVSRRIKRTSVGPHINQKMSVGPFFFENGHPGRDGGYCLSKVMTASFRSCCVSDERVCFSPSGSLALLRPGLCLQEMARAAQRTRVEKSHGWTESVKALNSKSALPAQRPPWLVAVRNTLFFCLFLG